MSKFRLPFTAKTRVGRFVTAAISEVLYYAVMFVVVTVTSYAVLTMLPAKELLLSPEGPVHVEQLPLEVVQLPVESAG